MRLLVCIFYLRFIIDLSDQQLIFLIKTRVLIVTSLKKMWNSRLHSFTLLTYELLKRSTIERNRPLPSKNSIRRFQQSIMRIKVRTIVESDLEHVMDAHPSSSKPPFPVYRQTHFQGVGSIAISIRIDREHVEHGLWRGRCVSHTGWSKSHAIRIPIAVSIQFARHFGHPVSWTTRIPLILNHLGPSNDDRAQVIRFRFSLKATVSAVSWLVAAFFDRRHCGYSHFLYSSPPPLIEACCHSQNFNSSFCFLRFYPFR